MLDLQHDQLLPSQSGRRSGMFLVVCIKHFLTRRRFQGFQSVATHRHVNLYNLILNLEPSNDDGDDNAHVKQGSGLDKQHNNFARSSHSFYISLPSLHVYEVKIPNLTFWEGRGRKKTIFLFSFSSLANSPSELNSRKTLQHLSS